MTQGATEYTYPVNGDFIVPCKKDTMVGEYQRRTQKGMGRNGKIPNTFGTKTQRRYAASAAWAIDMVRFFDISNKMSFWVKSLTMQKKPFFLILKGFILKINTFS